MISVIPLLSFLSQLSVAINFVVSLFCILSLFWNITCYSILWEYRTLAKISYYLYSKNLSKIVCHCLKTDRSRSSRNGPSGVLSNQVCSDAACYSLQQGSDSCPLLTVLSTHVSFKTGRFIAHSHGWNHVLYDCWFESWEFGHIWMSLAQDWNFLFSFVLGSRSLLLVLPKLSQFIYLCPWVSCVPVVKPLVENRQCSV